jgi:hypothetical protein
VTEKVALLLAHPDDELMCLPIIISLPVKFYLFYLTSNSKVDVDRFHEAKKSVANLRRIGVEVQLLEFETAFKDGAAFKDLNDFFIDHFAHEINSHGISSLFTFEYEGGHQDHDAVSVIGHLVGKLNNVPVSYFSGYRSTGFRVFFRTMKPEFRGTRITFPRLEVSAVFLRMLLVYRKQWKSWVWLGPGVLFSYLFRPWYLSKTTIDNIFCPNEYLYQKRGFVLAYDVEEILLGQLLKWK